MNCNYMKRKLIKAINEDYYRYFQEIGFDILKDDEHLYANVLANYYNIQMGVDANYICGLESMNMKLMLLDLKSLMNDETVFSSELARELQNNQEHLSDMVGIAARFQTTDITNEVIDLLIEVSTESYIVGGFVRDSILMKKSKDVDFVTDVKMDLLFELFESEGFKVQSEGKQFLVMIASKDGEQFEIANFRKDKGNTGGEIGNIFEDAQRRDFTCNSLYLNLRTKQLVDPNGSGIDDLQNNVLRFIGSAKERLEEDPIRAMRFYRFLTKGFTPESKSLKAVRTRFQRDSMKIVELQKVLSLKGVKEAIDNETAKRNTDKLSKRHHVIAMDFEELSETLLSLERMRLEIERIVGL